jgi:hypothetical protein
MKPKSRVKKTRKKMMLVRIEQTSIMVVNNAINKVRNPIHSQQNIKFEWPVSYHIPILARKPGDITAAVGSVGPYAIYALKVGWRVAPYARKKPP